MIDQNRISRSARRIRRFCLITVVAVPLLHTVYWIDPANSWLGTNYTVLWFVNTHEITRAGKIWGFVSMIPSSLSLMLVFYSIYSLMGELARGIYISGPTVNRIRWIGIGFWSYGIFSLLERTFIGASISMTSPGGESVIGIQITGNDVVFMVLGSVFLALAKMMGTEQERAEEQAQII